MGKPKAAAVCIHGSLLPLSNVLTYQSHRKNFVHMLGPRVKTFLHLTSTGAVQTEDRLRQLAKHLGADRRNIKVEVGGGEADPSKACAQVERLEVCMAMIRTEEKAASSQFGVVALLRSDTVFYAPLRPICMYSVKRGRRKEEWLYLFSRSAAEDFSTKLAQGLHGCHEHGRANADAAALELLHEESLAKDNSLPLLVPRAER